MYIVTRSMLWFYTGQRISATALYKWYTVRAVHELIDSGYLKRDEHGE